MNDQIVTVMNFECHDCGTKIGQMISDSQDPDNITCPNCKSTNVSFGTVFK